MKHRVFLRLPPSGVLSPEQNDRQSIAIDVDGAELGELARWMRRTADSLDGGPFAIGEGLPIERCETEET